MDFHGLSRKELQALCKKNKIPANITNVAMADALKGLEKVEGLEELMNTPSSDSQQSPEKTTNAEPRTAMRTSTRRKPINVEPESSQLLTRTRRATRRTTTEEAEQENKNANILETPAMPTSRRTVPATSARRKIDTQLTESGEDEKAVGEEKSDVPESTPAIHSSRWNAQAVSTRRTVAAQKDEKSAQRAYGTRHSVRLLEKSVADLSLKEERTVEVVKIEDLCDETEVAEQKDVPGDDSVIDESPENEVKEEIKIDYDFGLAENAKLEIDSESCSKLDSHPGIDAQDKDDDSSGESLLLQVEGSEKAGDMIDESIHKNGRDALIMENSETVAAALEPEIEKELIENQDSLIKELSDDSTSLVMETEHISIVNAADEVSVEVVDFLLEEASNSNSNDSSPLVMEAEHVSIVNAADEVSVEVADSLNPKVSEVEGKISVEVMDLSGVVDESSEMNLTEDEQHSSHNVHSVASSEEDSNGNDTEEESDEYESDSNDSSPLVLETEHVSIVNAAADVSVEVADSLNPKVCEVEGKISVEVMDFSEVVSESSEMNLTEDKQHSSHNMHSAASSEEDSDGNDTEEESDDYESDDSEENESAEIIQNEKSYIISEPENFIIHKEKCLETSDHLENDATEAKESAMIAQDSTPRSVKHNSPLCPLVTDSEVPKEEFTAAAESIQTSEKSPYQPLVSGDMVTGNIVSSPFAPNTIQGQFPRPTEPTPRKSSTKKQTTIKKIILADINKENIDNSGRKVEPKKEHKAKKKALENMSLRQLTKMYKELTIANKDHEEGNISKVGTRPALQILPENFIAAAETEQKN